MTGALAVIPSSRQPFTSVPWSRSNGLSLAFMSHHVSVNTRKFGEGTFHLEIWTRKNLCKECSFFVYCICAKGSSLPYLPFFDTYWSVHRCVPQCNRYALYPSWLVVQPISNNPSLLGMIIPNHGGNDIFRRQHIPLQCTGNQS